MDEPLLPPADLARTDRTPSWTAEVAGAALTGVTTAVLPVQRWSPAARWALHGGTGALVAVATAWSLHHLDRSGDAADPDEPTASPTAAPGPAATVAIALAGGTLAVGASRGGQAFDTWVERRLAARGVRRPRLWIGAAAAGLSLAARADRLTRRAAPDRSARRGRGA